VKSLQKVASEPGTTRQNREKSLTFPSHAAAVIDTLVAKLSAEVAAETELM